jgi:S-DNA-T family DNA segregation ATPase FtsK/SpoIIIE
MAPYADIPHLLTPVINEPEKTISALKWAVNEMERRYKLLAGEKIRNIKDYNKKIGSKGTKIAVADENGNVQQHEDGAMPYIVIVVDELADLMMVAARDVEALIVRLAQKARAVGIHLVLATQRPSVDVITGLIKANFPARISFKVSSKHDSRTIIDAVGAEHLLGSGDMLFMSGGASSMLRVHGAFVSETEITRVVTHWKEQGAPKLLDESVLKEPPSEEEAKEGGIDDFEDELYDQAIKIVTDTRQASISMIQRRLKPLHTMFGRSRNIHRKRPAQQHFLDQSTCTGVGIQ